MNKYEFLIRYSRISGKKSQKFKKILLPLWQRSSEWDEQKLLSQLQLTEQQKREFNEFNMMPIYKWCEKKDHSLLAYPDLNYPELLRQIHSPPLILFIKGEALSLLTPQIAMVGSRNFSDYGAQWGRYFANELALNGLTITSGLALGIDAICHRGALDVQGKTVAVLGSGLNHITPKTNLQLAFDIVDAGGAIISEFLPNETARPEFFPRRNRIISGLSYGTFIIEASEKSGSLITARYALEQNRDVFALPGEINQPFSVGTHSLIKQGAYLVTQPSDILEHYSATLSWAQQKTQPQEESRQFIHFELYSLLSHKPKPIDLLAQELNQPVQNIAIKLVELELEGMISMVTGGYIKNIISKRD